MSIRTILRAGVACIATVLLPVPTNCQIDYSTRSLVDSPSKIDLKEAKGLAQDVLSLIRNRYELDGIGAMFFLTANNMGSHVWDIIKYKFAKKIVQKDQQFLMIFGGSSVTAAHDNRYNQSYPAVVNRRLGPILKALGVKLSVNNIAQGANNCIPYTLCYESMGGLNPDFVGWEQSYNCGHDDPGNCIYMYIYIYMFTYIDLCVYRFVSVYMYVYKYLCLYIYTFTHEEIHVQYIMHMISVFETMARMTGPTSDRSLVYYSSSGAFTSIKCPPSNSTPAYSSEEQWDPEGTFFKYVTIVYTKIISACMHFI
jgi:hypothetical protein